MNIRNIRQIHETAAQRLDQAKYKNQIILIYGGIFVGLSALVTIVTYVLSLQISKLHVPVSRQSLQGLQKSQQQQKPAGKLRHPAYRPLGRQRLDEKQQGSHRRNACDPPPYCLHHTVTTLKKHKTDTKSSTAHPPVIPSTSPNAPPRPSISLLSQGTPIAAERKAAAL